MREIKFRAWTGKTMLYQDKQYLASFIRRIVPEIIRDHGGDEYREHESYLPNGGAIDEYLMQYTGLKDKNGREIYEGDIVKYLDNTGFGLVEKTVFIEDIRSLPDFTCSKWEEVIGNIYEHPKLIPEKP